jgi:hypothetical protein
MVPVSVYLHLDAPGCQWAAGLVGVTHTAGGLHAALLTFCHVNDQVPATGGSSSQSFMGAAFTIAKIWRMQQGLS